MEVEVSEQVTREMEPVEAPKRSRGIDSLRERMADATETVSRKYTKIFPITGWEDRVAVELRMLTYRETALIYDRAGKQKDDITGRLYAMTDQLIAATEGFHIVTESGEFEEIDGATWIDVARTMPDANLPQDLSIRQALLALVGDRNTGYLFAEFEQWQRTGGREVGQEVMRDFGMTP